MAVRNKNPAQNKSSVPITAHDIEWVRREAPTALDFYHRFGLGEVRSRAINIFLSGAIPLFGMAFLHWSVLTMLMFMAADAAVTVLADLIRYPIAKKWIYVSHNMDQAAGKVLLICDGLEDGTGRRADNGVQGNPVVVLFFSTVSLIFLLPIIGAATEHAGLASLREIVSEKSFLWVVGIDAAWRTLSGLIEAITIRFSKPGDKLIFLESGGVAILYAGLLFLFWLPLTWGHYGLVAMFVVIYTVRLAFGLFAYWWTPRSVAVIERRVKDNDFTIKTRNLP